MIPFDKKWIDSYPKDINENGCWVPRKTVQTDGYVKVCKDGIEYYLHRLSLCIYYNIGYYDHSTVTRHSKDCVRACFNYLHLTPGTDYDNARDKVLHGRNTNASKINCPKCGGEYTIENRRRGASRGQVKRHCRICKRKRRLELEQMKKNTEGEKNDPKT